MVFASDSFVFLFLPVFLIVYAITPAGLRNAVILGFSWLFYAWWRADFLPLLVVITAWSWTTGFLIESADGRSRRIALFVAIIGPLSALGWFKYANLLANTAIGFGAPLSGWQAVIMPIGLSFFVFGAISYSVDVFRGVVRAESSFINYATYQSMFGHLVAGPIVRYQWVAERLKSRMFDRAEFVAGVQRFMLGFSQKVLLADTLAPMVDAGFLLSSPTTIDVCLSVTAFAMQLYFDFAGYSSMAIGLGMMVGLRFPENFLQPYLSTSLQDFWRRWHISLSSWLRDYLYIPLGGNRGGHARVSANLMITMALGGLWHGASWTFLVWGLWHGAGLMVMRLWHSASLPSLPAWLGHLVTLIFVMLGWLLFRAQTWAAAGTMAGGLAGFHGIGLSDGFAAATRPIEYVTMIVSTLVIYAPLCSYLSPRAIDLGRQLAIWSSLPLYLAALWVLQGRAVIPFLYFQF